MNNDAFKKMVRERAQIKSTKEIAREAVEDEFQRKKKRKYGGDSSDSGGEQEAKDESSGKKRFGRSKQQQNEEDDENLNLSSNYRDRAKERREGKSQADESLLKGVASAAADPAADKSTEELSKYLGGDEEHTHLVKGLDVVLARKVKREWHKEKNQQPTTTAKESKQQMAETTFVETVEQAKDLLQQCIQNNNTTTEAKVGLELFQYLQKVHKYNLEMPLLLPKNVACSSAGRTIQRSTLAFALDGHPSQISRAWEMPREIMHGASQQETLARATSLDISLIDRIQWALSKRIKKTEEEVQQPAKPTPMSATTEKVVQQSLARATSQEGGDDDDDDDDDGDDDDDDIFGDVGDYVPSQTQSQTKSAKPKPAVSAGSIFSGLVQEEQQSKEEEKGSTAVDTFVASLYSRLQKGREGAEPTLKGLLGSTEGYNEMDVDFDGQLEDKEEEDDGGKSSKKKKKKRGEETTVAASEYGAARNRSARGADD
jgi:IK cytokine